MNNSCEMTFSYLELENPVSNYVCSLATFQRTAAIIKIALRSGRLQVFPAKEVHNVSLFYIFSTYMLCSSPSMYLLYLIRNSITFFTRAKNTHIFTYSIAMYKNLVFAFNTHSSNHCLGGVRRFERETRSPTDHIETCVFVMYGKCNEDVGDGLQFGLQEYNESTRGYRTKREARHCKLHV